MKLSKASMDFTDYSSSSATASLLPFGCFRVAYLRQVVGSLHVGRCSVPGHVKILSLRSSFSSEPSPKMCSSLGLIDFLFLSINRAAAVASQASTWASAKVIDGKLVAKEIKQEIAAQVSRMKDAIGLVPGLAVMLVGELQLIYGVQIKGKRAVVIGRSNIVGMPDALLLQLSQSVVASSFVVYVIMHLADCGFT
ncbi:Bifunctional protein FolD 4, chloroplastic [Linum perenne]